ncbi:MAG: hypothetical protein NTW11_01750 [Candidatus Staskawiczbacteria bacterium]|nr:hypothetical protein [Candidatus Staskawiczbacteria bacterium]
MKNQRGYIILMMTFFTLIIMTSIAISMSFLVANSQKNATNSVKATQAYYASESGIEDALLRLKKTPAIATLTYNLDVSGITTSVYIPIAIGGSRAITSQVIDNEIIKKLEVVVNISDSYGASFYYGIMAGSGGLSMQGNSIVAGNVFSNGNITGSGTINNDAIISGAGNSISGVHVLGNVKAHSCSGATVGGDLTYVNAGIFGPCSSDADCSSSSVSCNSVQQCIQGGGFGSCAGYRDCTELGCNSSNQCVSGGGLGPCSVDADCVKSTLSCNSSKQCVNGGGFGSCTSSKNCNNSGCNSSYKCVVGGTLGTCSSNGDCSKTTLSCNSSNQCVQGGGFGSCTSNNDCNTSGCNSSHQCVSGGTNTCTVSGTITSQTQEILEQPMPIPESQIQAWEDSATGAGNIIYNGNYTSPSGGGSMSGPGVINGNVKVRDWSTFSLGNVKINGNLEIGFFSTLNLTGPVYVTGDIVPSFIGVNKIKVDQSFGPLGGVIIADGKINMGLFTSLAGSGSPGSYVLLISNSTADDAIALWAISSGGVFYTTTGGIYVGTIVSPVEITGKKITMASGSKIQNSAGAVNIYFTSGQAGGWKISSWQEY